MTEYQDENLNEAVLDSNKCPHYWLIDPPKGPTSKGICKLCGASKEFNNQYSAQTDRSSQVTGKQEIEEPVSAP